MLAVCFITPAIPTHTSTFNPYSTITIYMKSMANSFLQQKMTRINIYIYDVKLKMVFLLFSLETTIALTAKLTRLLADWPAAHTASVFSSNHRVLSS